MSGYGRLCDCHCPWIIFSEQYLPRLSMELWKKDRGCGIIYPADVCCFYIRFFRFMMLPTIRQLQYLVAVIELRHFGQAAERCFVTQSTLSAGIQELELLLGAKLLERTKRKVIPTQLGVELSEKAQQLLGLAAEMVVVAQADDKPLTGRLRLGVIPTIGPFILPLVLPGIRERFPGMELFLLEDQTARLLARIAAGDLDAAILALPYDIGRLESETFWSEDFWVAIPDGHPLSNGGLITAQELPVDELLLLEEGHCFRDHVLTACHMEGLRSSAAFQGTSLYTLTQMVAGGQGITFIPEMAVGSALMKQSNICFRPLSEKGPHRQISLVWRPSYHRKRDLQTLAESMNKLLAVASANT
ncbi:Hydrogen peroxide-inducible genes activator =_ OxyR [hydrothermal vent metagenome]|uniref:Hydrogen peroxide-inducible genes activator => OxyR n=1 Tax=hydrothermal vent metagenome TaxID=652676 RepID=A0A3B1BJ84_9ZZZZ